ncbi:hypothetical protein MG293_020817 [Ovis ammon polii]|uniref:Uncharacterized protein n=1 Tax=Ovis ammon polii TaxID=230172 RepID=A0AAD4TJ61_OVIAM|nr:hypothetical protein MG293_020817 [Ovis ammon polii]
MEDTEVVVYQEQKQVSSEEQGQEHPRPGAPSDRLALEALVALQLELDPVNKKAQRAHARLKHKNCQRRRVHLEHRSAIIQGIPGFWVEVRSQSELSLAPGTLQRKGLSGIQFFSEKLSEFGGEVVMRYQASCSTPVQWYQGFERKAYSRRHHDSSVNFFNWFFDHNFSGSDWIAEIIIKDLWPNPLQYYVKRKAPPQEVLEGQEVVMVVAVTPALGFWEDERVRTSISGGDWLPAVVDGGALLRLKPIHENTKQKADGTQTDLQGCRATEFYVTIPGCHAKDFHMNENILTLYP